MLHNENFNKSQEH